jgi:putative tricarboxylic transport membrane protein
VKQFEFRRSVEGGSVVLLGVFILLLIPSQIKAVVQGETGMSPSFIPALVAAGLILAGLGLLAKAYFTDTVHPAIDVSRAGLLRVLTSLLLLIAYTVLFPLLGFVTASGLCLGVLIIFFGSRSWRKILMSAVLVPIVLWIFFEKLFLIPLPHGILF